MKYLSPPYRLATYLCTAAVLLFMAGCDTVDEEEGLFYEAPFLTALNSDVSEVAVEADGLFSVEDDVFFAEVAAINVTPDAVHPQHIHAEGTCPPPEADTNEDGYIDVVEGVPYYGQILVPLDSDLSSTDPGVFPEPEDAAYDYVEDVAWDALLDNLQAEDPNPDDAVVKLEEGEELNLAERTVVIHGVALDTPLPETVQSIGGLPPQVTLPVACSEIVRTD